MATETPAVPVAVPDENAPGEPHPAENVEAPDPEEELLSNASSGGNPVNDAACSSASPFSYAELEEKLKQIPPSSTTAMPSAKTFEMVETVYCFFLLLCHFDVFLLVWFITLLFLLVCLNAAGKWSSRHGSTTRFIH